MTKVWLFCAVAQEMFQTKKKSVDEHAQTQSRDGAIATELIHHLRVGAVVERSDMALLGERSMLDVKKKDLETRRLRWLLVVSWILRRLQ